MSRNCYSILPCNITQYCFKEDILTKHLALNITQYCFKVDIIHISLKLQYNMPSMARKYYSNVGPIRCTVWVVQWNFSYWSLTNSTTVYIACKWEKRRVWRWLFKRWPTEFFLVYKCVHNIWKQNEAVSTAVIVAAFMLDSFLSRIVLYLRLCWAREITVYLSM